jgi:hypothetical protein
MDVKLGDGVPLVEAGDTMVVMWQAPTSLKQRGGARCDDTRPPCDLGGAYVIIRAAGVQGCGFEVENGWLINLNPATWCF